MKHVKLLAILIVPLAAISCHNGNDTNNYKGEAEITMVSMLGEKIGEGEYKDSLFYNDEWFSNKSTQLDNELALASAMVSASSYSNSLDSVGNKATNFLSSVGYSNIQKNYYYEHSITLQDSIGALIGSKEIKDKNGEKFTLLAVFTRNGGYEDEWMGNFNIDADGNHVGFMLARDELLRFTKSYIDANNISGSLKVWASGYSRGAAVINLYSAFLADGASYLGNNVTLDVSNIYSYTIATPSTISTSMDKNAFLSVSGPRGEGFFDTDVPAYPYTGSIEKVNPSDAKYNYIHSVIATGDYVTKLPPKSYGFARFGKTEEIVFGSDKMLEYLGELSPETAKMFEGGRNYATKEPTSTFNFETLNIDDGDKMMSPNEVIDERIEALTNLTPTVKEFVEDGYKDALGALVSSFGCDYSGIADNISSVGIGGIIKAAILAYLSNAAKRMEQSDNETLSTLIIQLMGLLGKPVSNPEEYNDQKLLKDLFDLIINDYQTSEKAKIRLIKLAFFIPAPYGSLFLKLVKYADDNEITVSVMDDFLYLIASYYNDHQDDEAMLQIIDMLAGAIPEDYVSLLSWITGKTYDDEQYPTAHDKAVAAVKDLVLNCVLGNPDADITPAGFRFTILSLVPMFLPESAPKLNDLLLNGTTNTNGEEVVKEPASLPELADDILTLAMPKDDETGERKTLQEAANDELISLLETCRTEKVSKYIDIIIDNLEVTKDMLIAFVFNPGDTYSLSSDIDNALTFYKTIKFIAPAHFAELYVTYLKSVIVK